MRQLPCTITRIYLVLTVLSSPAKIRSSMSSWVGWMVGFMVCLLSEYYHFMHAEKKHDFRIDKEVKIVYYILANARVAQQDRATAS